jgi:glycosyltransferase involved in cell wall biosynthesis
MIFGSLDPFVASPSPELMIGIKVANYEFIKALLTYGTFDEYHFFMPADFARRNLEGAMAHWDLKESLGQRIKFFNLLDLKQALGQNHYHVFHQGDFMTYFPALCHFRNRYAAHPFPITGVTHTLSYSKNMLKYAEINASHAIQPYDAIICTSNTAIDVLKNAFGALKKRTQADHTFAGQFQRIALGIDTNRFKPRDKNACRTQLGLAPDKLIFLNICRFSLHKKMDLYPLLTAFKAVLTRLKNDKPFLLLAGSDDVNYIPLLEDFATRLGIRAHVGFKKNFSNAEAAMLYSAADIFVSPSDNLQETFGLSVVEAMASGLPVVVSDFDGYKDLVEDKVDGFRIPVVSAPCVDTVSELGSLLFKDIAHLYYAQSTAIDIEQMVTALVDLALNEKKRLDMGVNAARSAREKFSWKNVIHRYEAVWKNLNDRAQTHHDSDAAKNDPYALDYSAIFKDYASITLGDQHQVATSPFGQDVLEGRFTFPIYPDMLNILDTKILIQVLSIAQKDPTSIADIINHCTQETDSNRETVLYQIMWMLKQNMLTLSGA